jgi:hypothetical protein
MGVLGLPLLVTPLLLVGAALSTTAFVLGVKAKRQAGRTQGTAPGATVGIVTGLLGMGVFVISMVLGLTMLQEINDYQKCMETANTITDEDQCRNRFNDQLERKLHIKSNRFVGVNP